MKKHPGKEVKHLLTEKQLRLKIAESFTGGYLTSLLTAMKGASGYLIESIICYSHESKIKRLNVNQETINAYGTVSAACLRQMLKGLLESGNCDIAVATTGNASRSVEKIGKKGDCFIGIADKNEIRIYKYNFSGTRKKIISMGANAALNHLTELLQSY